MNRLDNLNKLNLSRTNVDDEGKYIPYGRVVQVFVISYNAKFTTFITA